MNKLFTLIILSFIPSSVFSQAWKLLDYPHRKISVSCSADKPAESEECYFIESIDEFNELCTDKGAGIDFGGRGCVGRKSQ